MTDPEMSVRAVAVLIGDSQFSLELEGGEFVKCPYADFPRLARATPAQRRNWEWLGGRTGIRWPTLDEDLSVWSLVHPEQTVTSRSAASTSQRAMRSVRVPPPVSVSSVCE
jgi:hypothetical protein